VSGTVARSKPRVFLDSNVIFSGLYSSKRAPGIILEHFIRGNIRVVVSQQVLEEVIRTLKEKLPDTLPSLKKLLVSTPPEIIADPSLKEIERWAGKIPESDVAILVAAIVAKPDYFITGDNHFISNPIITGETGLYIVTPAQFLKIFGRDEAY
jgi:putative PIN family toxin of toxin-antitoxin system